MKFLKWVLGFFVFVLTLPVVLASESLVLPLVVGVGLMLWRLAAHRFDLYHSLRILTTSGYLGVAAAMVVLMESENTTTTPWMLVGVAFTVALVVRTAAQEKFLSSRNESWVSAGRGSFAERAYLRTVSPPAFRWLHRAFALWWVWALVINSMQQRGPEPFENYATMLAPGFLLLLGGPFVALLFIPFFFLALAFLATLPGLPWVASSILWMVVASLRSPTDRRTNHYRAFRSARQDWPWYFMT